MACKFVVQERSTQKGRPTSKSFTELKLAIAHARASKAKYRTVKLGKMSLVDCRQWDCSPSSALYWQTQEPQQRPLKRARRATAQMRKRTRQCKFGVNKRTGDCLKHPRKKKR